MTDAWDLPPWPEAYPLGTTTPDGYARERWRLVVAVPDAVSPFDDADDFRRRALTTIERDVRIYPTDGYTSIVVPEDYAIALDATRPLRAVLDDRVAAPPNGALGTPFDPRLLRRALPEQVATLLGTAPMTGDVSAIVLLDEPNPADAWHRQTSGDPEFVSAASAAGSEITFFAAELSPMLREQFAHELAHVLAAQYVGDRGWFDVASSLDGDYMHRARAAVSLEESWAVHLGECILGESGDAYTHFCDAAPIRAAVLGTLLERATERGDLARRIEHLTTTVRAHALDRLRAIANNPALRLTLWLLRGQPLLGFETLTQLDLSRAYLASHHLRSLVTCTALETLDLSGTLLNREGLGFASALTRLRTLSLRGTNVYSSTLRHLARLPLESLDIGGTHVHESSLPTLARLRTLRHLRIDGTELASAAEYLRRALPECVVEA